MKYSLQHPRGHWYAERLLFGVLVDGKHDTQASSAMPHDWLSALQESTLNVD